MAKKQAAKLADTLDSVKPYLERALTDDDFRREARRTLVGIYFTPTEQVMLCARLGLPAPNTDAIAALRPVASGGRI